MKKILSLFIIFIVICSLYGCDKKSKSIYTLTFAYENNLISYDDLLTLAYYNNYGTEYNEEIMGDNFVPKTIYPTKLDSKTENEILLYLSKEEGTKEDYSIVKYYGVYNNAVAIKYSSSLYDIPAVETFEAVAGVTFCYPSYKLVIYA